MLHYFGKSALTRPCSRLTAQMFIFAKYAIISRRLIIGNSDIICSYWLDETNVKCTDKIALYNKVYSDTPYEVIFSNQPDVISAINVGLISLFNDVNIPVMPQFGLRDDGPKTSDGKYQRITLSARLHAAVEIFMCKVFDQLY